MNLTFNYPTSPAYSRQLRSLFLFLFTVSFSIILSAQEAPTSDQFGQQYSQEQLQMLEEKNRALRPPVRSDSLVPPANDNFASAIVMSSTSGSAVFTNVEATGETGEPIHGAGFGGTGAAKNSVWYRFTAPSTGVLTVWTSADGATPIGDSVISSYSGAAVNALTPMAENDDYGANFYSRITFGVASGQTVHIALDGYSTATGTFRLQYEFTAAAANNNFASAESLGTGSSVRHPGITGSNVGATGETGEPNHHGVSSPNRSVWYTWTPSQTYGVTFDTTGSSYDTVLAVYTGGAVNGLTLVASNDDFGPELQSRVSFTAAAGTTYRIAVAGFLGSTGNILLNWFIERNETGDRFNFDGDIRTDRAIFRPSNGQWWVSQSSSTVFATTFGVSTDRITPGDFTGDGRTDIAFWRPSTGAWFVLRSENNTYYSFPFGATGDIPVVGHFDNDAKDDAAVFRPSAGVWYVFNSRSGSVSNIAFGVNGDVPVVADYDADGASDIAIYRPSNGQWWLRRSTLGLIATTFGSAADKPAPSDYTGDGKADIAFWRPSTGEWFVLRSEDNTYYAFPFGATGDIPAPGDYTGDNKSDATVFRPSNAVWYTLSSNNGSVISVPFGVTGDRPVPSAFIP